MSLRSVPLPGKLLISVIYREEGVFREAAARIVGLFGEAERTSEAFPFDRTEYYTREMGAPLSRRFIVTAGEYPRDSLADAKIAAEKVEGEFSTDGRRAVNVDPGLLTDENFLLATGKNYSHRIYLRDGVFADLTLVFRGGEYRPLSWTYPDCASDAIRAFLGEVRADWRNVRKTRGGEAPCG
jgi:hypothetical protein